MAKVIACEVPSDSLLAGFGSPTAYRDCFVSRVPDTVSLPQFVAQFYGSVAFRPERLLLGLIGRGATIGEIHALARGEHDRFAAWNVVARTNSELLLQDFRGATASWLAVEPAQDGSTELRFGSWVGQPERALVKALMPFHRWYLRMLLSAAG